MFFKKPNPFSVISFDLDDTLWDNGPIIKKADDAVFKVIKQKYSNLPCNNNETLGQYFLKIRQNILSVNPKALIDVTQIRLDIYSTALSEFNYDPADARQLVDLFLEKRSEFEVPASALALLQIAFDKYPLIAITNGNVNLEALGIKQYFNQVIVPTDCEARKPSKLIFDFAAQIAQASPEQILHIGDHALYDVDGANKANMQSIWFTPFDEKANYNNLSTLPVAHFNTFEELEAFI